MAKDYVSVDQKAGFNQSATVEFHSVYKVAEISKRGLITTSGRLGVTNLTDVVAIIIADYSNRPMDWIVSLNGVVVAQIHTDDSVTYP
jgi:hypothetical protein